MKFRGLPNRLSHPEWLNGDPLIYAQQGNILPGASAGIQIAELYHDRLIIFDRDDAWEIALHPPMIISLWSTNLTYLTLPSGRVRLTADALMRDCLRQIRLAHQAGAGALLQGCLPRQSMPRHSQRKEKNRRIQIYASGIFLGILAFALTYADFRDSFLFLPFIVIPGFSLNSHSGVADETAHALVKRTARLKEEGYAGLDFRDVRSRSTHHGALPDPVPSPKPPK